MKYSLAQINWSGFFAWATSMGVSLADIEAYLRITALVVAVAVPIITLVLNIKRGKK